MVENIPHAMKNDFNLSKLAVLNHSKLASSATFKSPRWNALKIIPTMSPPRQNNLPLHGSDHSHVTVIYYI